jgi:glycerophosphoryl diester phosphodiesterase
MDACYFADGWHTSEYIAPCDGEYILNMSNITEVVQSNAGDLGNRVYVELYRHPTKENIKRTAQPPKVLSINHRGYNTVAPENTIPAFKLSKKNGYDFVECDVKWTSDNVPVLLHDAYINNVARNADGTALDGTKYIADMTYEQALAYDFGILKGAEYAGTKIATFEEFIRLCRNIGLHPYIHVASAMSKERIKILVDMVRDYGLERNASWLSEDVNNLAYVVEENPFARCGRISYWNVDGAEYAALMAKWKTPYNEVFWSIQYDLVTENTIAICKEAGIPLEVYCPNEVAEILALDPYITGVTNDKNPAGKVLYDNEMGTENE